MKYYIGIDLGGTNIAAGLVSEEGRILQKMSVPTLVNRGTDAIMDDIAMLCEKLCTAQGITLEDTEKIGIGIPGTVSTQTGMVMYSCNLPLEKVNVRKILEDKCKRIVSILNDADAAAYGEYVVSAEKSDSFVCITLGTGVGAGIIIGGRIYNGFNGAGAEIGHTTLIKDGIQCSCGRRGCWEKYASATALVTQAEEAVKKNPESLMALADELNGKVVFDSADKGDETAIKVVEKYIEYVAEGILNVVNVFQPSKIVIGGGISHQGEAFVGRVREYVYSYDYNRYIEKTQITTATLFNDAGIIGAALY